MFYHGIPLTLAAGSERAPAAALAVLTPSESKRLIAKAVAALPEIETALQSGWIIISRGTTNAFVAEELMGVSIENKIRYAAGIISQGKLGIAPRETQMKPFVLHKGQPAELLPEKALEGFGPDDVFIKGANAVDLGGNTGVLVAGEQGGTIGGALTTLSARGSHLIMPIGLEKLVPSVADVAYRMGTRRYKYSMGMNVGLIPVSTGQVVTEIQALKVLSGATASHAASGGIGNSQGSVVLVIEGEEEAVEKAWAIIQSIKGEHPVA
ncbi:MAG: hypothetical protein HY676_02040 [Chloroflexi bacterium]|nr:hypothetical protein [Chloroflexota bacterium]